MIIDTHCHLDDNRYDNDLDEVLENAYKNGVKSMIIPGADLKTLSKAVKISENHEDIFFAVGVHPYDIDEYSRDELEKFIHHPKCVAVGECGLDYYRLPKDKDEQDIIKRRQKEVFIDQIDLAKKHKKPLIVHIRDASEDSLNILKDYADKNFGGVLHCFNASPILLELVEYNFYYGIGGVVTFKNAKKLIEILPQIPIDRIILETDAPYLTPHPHRGKRNEPGYTRLVLEKISEILGEDKEKLEKMFYENSIKLFKLPLKDLI